MGTTEWGQPNDKNRPEQRGGTRDIGVNGPYQSLKTPTRTVSNCVIVSRARCNASRDSGTSQLPRIRYQISATRVALLVDGLQAAVFDVRINLRGADTGVPQHFLEGSDIRTACQQMRGKTVP